MNRAMPSTSRRASAVLFAALACVGALWLAGSMNGQPQLGNLLPHARLASVLPCGGKADTTFEVTLTGTDLGGAEALVFSHPGITATFIAPPPMPEPKPIDPKVKAPKQQPLPPPMPKFAVTIGPGVPVGHYDVRFVGKYGITNARTFVVGDLIEVLEREPNNDVDQAQRVEINSTVTGTVAQPSDVDYFVFAGKKGQRVLIQCQCATIDSKLTPDIKLLDANNRELASHRAAPLSDGLVDVNLPLDGDYKVRLVQSAHQLGGPELFYRLSITTGPWIDSVFPPMVQPGQATEVTVYGRNLPGGELDPKAVAGGRPLERLTVTIEAPQGTVTQQQLAFSGQLTPALGMLDGFEYRIQRDGMSSNPVLLAFANAPVVLETPHHASAETAQEVTVPCEIAGRIDQRRDRDWYSFSAKKGDIFIIEALSQRLGAPTDLYLTVRNATGKQAVDMAQLDDNPETVNPVYFATANRDPAPYRFVAPADGKYQLLVGSHVPVTAGDIRHVYRIRITPERPDFRLIVMPADTYRPDAGILGAAGNLDFTVFVLRQDGFNGEVAMSVEGLPPDVAFKPQVMGPGVKQGSIVLNGGFDAKPWAGLLTVKGAAQIDGKTVEREARPASITWQVPPASGFPTVTRLERSLGLAVRGAAPYTLNCGFDAKTVMHGGPVTIPLKLTRHQSDFKGPVQVVAVPIELPPGVSFGNVTFPPDKNEQSLILNVPANVIPGTYTFAFKSFGAVPSGPKGNPVNVVQSSSAVVLTVVPKQVARLTISNSAPALKPGDKLELVVKVTRQFEFKDSFKVKLVLPADAKGISADEIMIPAVQNEVKLVLHADENAVPGPRNNLVVQVSAVVKGMTLTQEAKINVNVAK